MSQLVLSLDQRRADLLAAADDWERFAVSAETAQQWDIERGIFAAVDAGSPGYWKARGARDSATALRLEAQTGIPHCNCHHTPVSQCSVLRGTP